MSRKTVIAGLAAVAILAGTTLMPTGALAQRGGHGVGGHGGGFHAGGGSFHAGGGWGGIYPGWGYELYPSCGYVHVKYYRHRRPHWHWIYVCE